MAYAPIGAKGIYIYIQQTGNENNPTYYVEATILI